MIKRCLEEEILKDLEEKMAFLSGRRFYFSQLHMEGKDDVLDGRVRVMPSARFLTALP